MLARVDNNLLYLSQTPPQIKGRFLVAFRLQTFLQWCIVRGMKDPHDDLIFPALSEEMDDTKRPGVLRRFWNATLKILGKIGYYLLCTIGIILSVVVSLSFWIAPIVGVVWLVIYFAFPETRGRDDTEEELPIEERQAQALGAVLQNMQPLDALSAVIKSGYPIIVTYDGVERLAHPYRLGRNPKTGNLLLRVWEESKAGHPTNAFRTYTVAKIKFIGLAYMAKPIDLPEEAYAPDKTIPFPIAERPRPQKQ